MCKPLVFAHRGASGTQFENSMVAFEQAVRFGADGLEIDVQLSRDGVPVVIHDEQLKRLAGKETYVSELSLQELRQVKIGKRFRRLLFPFRIPTLQETVQFVVKHELALNVELKQTVLERPDQLSEIIQLVRCVKNVHISSFYYQLLEMVKQLDPKIETAWIVRKKQTDWKNLKKYDQADAFHFHKRLWKAPYQQAFLKSQKILRMYGVTGSESFISQASINIDGWITDYPENFL